MIASSELIITPHNTIYHLDLAPGEIAETIITVGDPDRVHEVSKHFDSIEIRKQHREFVTHTGFIGNKRITVISTGIGTDNIDIVLNELDALVNIDFTTRTIKPDISALNIIRIGTSGALQKDIEVDSIVASTHGIGMDNLMLFYNTEEYAALSAAFRKDIVKDNPFTVYAFAGSEKLLRLMRSSSVVEGMTVTCSGFYGPQGRVLRAPLKDSAIIDRLTQFRFVDDKELRITNFEMETSGIYGISKMLGHEALSMNAIVANRVNKQFSKDGKLAVEKLIRYVLDRICDN
jgi:uridine phosphorylase